MSSIGASKAAGVTVCVASGLGDACQHQVEAVEGRDEQFGPKEWGLD